MIRMTVRGLTVWLKKIDTGVYDVWMDEKDEKYGRVVHKIDGWHAFDTWGFPMPEAFKTRKTAVAALTIED